MDFAAFTDPDNLLAVFVVLVSWRTTEIVDMAARVSGQR